MPRAERYRRMTIAQREAKWDRQRRQRLTKPAYNGNLRGCFENRQDYYALYNYLFEKQGGVCAICSNQCATGRRLNMDHCHKTLKVRGLLCWSCNYKLGFVEKHLAGIVKYLRGGG
jgi:hypothetical protein